MKSINLKFFKIVNRKGLYLLLKNYLHGDFIINTARKNTKMYKLIG